MTSHPGIVHHRPSFTSDTESEDTEIGLYPYGIPKQALFRLRMHAGICRYVGSPYIRCNSGVVVHTPCVLIPYPLWMLKRSLGDGGGYEYTNDVGYSMADEVDGCEVCGVGGFVVYSGVPPRCPSILMPMALWVYAVEIIVSSRYHTQRSIKPADTGTSLSVSSRLLFYQLVYSPSGVPHPRSQIVYAMPQVTSLEWHGCEEDYRISSQQLSLSRLNSIYNSIECFPSAFLDTEIQKSLSIKCEELKLTENGLYNNPKSEPCFFKHAIPIKDYPPSFKPGDAYSNHQQSVHAEIREYEGNPRKSRQAAYTLVYEIIRAFSAYQRTGPERIDNDLSALTDWLTF